MISNGLGIFSRANLKVYIGLVCFLFSNMVFAVQSILLFEDPTGSVTAEEVVANPQWFTPTTDLNRSFSESTFWVKIDIENTMATTQERVIQLDSSMLPVVEQYAQTEQGIAVRKDGYMVPFDARSVRAQLIAFPILIPPNSVHTSYLKIQSPYKIDLDYAVRSLSQAAAHLAWYSILNALVVGALSMLLAYNLFLAFTVNARIYLICSAFLAITLWVSIMFFRFYELWGMTLDVAAAEARTGPFMYGLAFVFLGELFKDNETKLVKSALWLAYGLMVLHFFLDAYYVMYFYSHFSGFVIYLLITFIIINAWRQGNPLAKFIMAGWAIVILFSLGFVGNLWGILGPEFEPFIVYGNLVEGVTLSAVLSYRLRTLDQTKELLRLTQVELRREQMAAETGFGYKWQFDVDRWTIQPDETFAKWNGDGWQAGEWYPAGKVFKAVPENYKKILAKEFKQKADKAIADPKYILILEHPMVRADTGQVTWVKLFGKLMFESGHKIMVGSALDITYQVNKQEQLEELLNKQKEMFAIIGHELRTPVVAMSMMVNNESLSPQEKLLQIGDISENLLSVLEDLRVVVAPERALESKVSDEDPINIVQRALTSLTPLIEKRGFKLEAFIERQAGTLFRFHAQALRQIVTNLVKNAVLHSGGSLLRVSFDFVTDNSGTATACLMVEDDGVGIPDTLRVKIFEAFGRGNTQSDGSGLGLYIAKQLAEKMHGHLSYAVSQLGGACFTLEFSIQIASQGTQKPVTPVEPSASLKGMKILLAEDDATIRLLTEKILESEGAVVDSFVNGKLAYDGFSSAAYDLVITDMMMPEMDGIELIKAIRATGATTIIVAATAAVVGKETDHLLAAGADAVLAKPVNANMLLETIQNIFTHRH